MANILSFEQLVEQVRQVCSLLHEPLGGSEESSEELYAKELQAQLLEMVPSMVAARIEFGQVSLLVPAGHECWTVGLEQAVRTEVASHRDSYGAAELVVKITAAVVPS